MKFLTLLSFVFLGMSLPFASFAYPGCPVPDIIIGGQMWSACNATSKGTSSGFKSGWYFAGEKFPIYMSYNGIGETLYPEIRNRASDFQVGPCAKGYRIPNRGEWETAIWYARLGNVSISTLLGLPQNGGYCIYRDNEKIAYASTENVLASYWTSTREDIYGTRPIILHIRSHRTMTYTEGSYQEPESYMRYSDDGAELVTGEIAEIANVRCIKK